MLRFAADFPYQTPLDRPHDLPRPMLWTRLRIGRAVTPSILALVDSGADVSAFQLDLAHQLGIDLTACRQTVAQGVGGRATAYACSIEMEVARRRFPAEVRFVPMRIALLGRNDVFAQFRLAFDQRASVLHADPYDI